MRVLGLSDLGRRAQSVMQDDARCVELLGMETDNEFHLYQLVVRPHDKSWASYYSLWARVLPLDPKSQNNFRLEHMAISGQWQKLDVEGSFEYCIRQLMENRYHLFFG